MNTPTFITRCNRMRAECKEIEQTARRLTPVVCDLEGHEPQEVNAHLMLAVRHLEDARMRFGKAIQYAGDGVSKFDKPEMPFIQPEMPPIIDVELITDSIVAGAMYEGTVDPHSPYGRQAAEMAERIRSELRRVQPAGEPESWQDRVHAEKAELEERLTKLNKFIDTDEFEGLAPLARQQLVLQQSAMGRYLDILVLRIAEFQKESEG